MKQPEPTFHNVEIQVLKIVSFCNFLSFESFEFMYNFLSTILKAIFRVRSTTTVLSKQFWASATALKAIPHLNRLSLSVTFLILTAQVPRSLKADPMPVQSVTVHGMTSEPKRNCPLVHSYCEHSACSSKICRWKSALKLFRRFQRYLRAWQRNQNIQEVYETKSNSAVLEIKTGYAVNTQKKKNLQNTVVDKNRGYIQCKIKDYLG